MEKIVINGGKPLYGNIEVSGMKNAALPIIFANILVEDKCVIENVPNISDVSRALEILASMGAHIRRLSKTVVEIDSTGIRMGKSPFELVRKMRGSYYIIGAELGRFGSSYVAYPGGCDFGVRPIDQHIKAFELLGTSLNIEGGYIDARTNGGLIGSQIFFDVVSVGATINAMIAAVRAKGMTVIENAAREPHVVDLANFLNTCGANITGAGTDVIKIKGVPKLHGCNYAIIPDMIEAGTFMLAAAATSGSLRINNVIPKHLESISAKLIEMGASVVEGDDFVIVSRNGPLNKVNIKTLPYPGFPTDMNPQICVLLCLAKGTSLLNEGVWDNRFRYVEELKRMGASIKVDGRTAIVDGETDFSGATVRAVDLRAGIAMVIAGLTARGVTEIEDIYHIERGYDNVVAKLQAVGADITKKTMPPMPKEELA